MNLPPSNSRSKDRISQKKGGSNALSEFFLSTSVRETIESIIIAFVLAFLFRTFEAEAFVIPTGSMATTLMGRHKDTVCPECGTKYRTGASSENAESNSRLGMVVGATCPGCHYVTEIDPHSGEAPSYTGDRILVCKFIYDMHEPERWDVIVFKFPNNAKLNYIKRLIGKPGETIKLYQGDVYVIADGESEYQIARKPPHKIRAMLQSVSDSHHVSGTLTEAGWPARWQDSNNKPDWETFESTDGNVIHRSFSVDATKSETPAWLRYHHFMPSTEDWRSASSGRQVQPPVEQLVSDSYAYNGAWHMNRQTEMVGHHWVGDLAFEASVKVTSNEGVVLLDLVEGGRHHVCAIDVADGSAELSMFDLEHNPIAFGTDTAETGTLHPQASTKVHGQGKYNLRLANVDEQIVLWVNNKPVTFDEETTFASRDDVKPDWTDTDLGDLAPAGIGSQGASLEVSHLKILRDIYYIAVKGHTQNLLDYEDFEYIDTFGKTQYRQISRDDWTRVLTNPRGQSQTLLHGLFDSRRSVEFELEKFSDTPHLDQFLPMGDNSPQSSDGRLWDNGNFFERKFLIGKAVFVYWPHAKNTPLPFTPNFERMKFIR